MVCFICSYPKPTKKKTKYFVFISFLLLLFFRTFVDLRSVPDLEAYSWGYEQISNISFSKLPTVRIYDVKISEIGFRYFMKSCSIFSSSFTFFLFVFGILWLVGYLKVIKKYSPHIIISLILLIVGSYNQSIFVLRQHLAMVVVFLSYKYIIEKDFPKYIGVIALAFLLHQTAIIVLPLYFLYNVKGKMNVIMLMIFVAVFLYYSFSYMLINVGNDVLRGYSLYIDSDEKTNATGAIIVAFELLTYTCALKGHVLTDGINRILFLSLVVGLIISICGIGYNPTSRLVMYYTSISFLTIPIIAKYIKNNILRNTVVVLFVAIYTYVTFEGSGFASLEDYRLDL